MSGRNPDVFVYLLIDNALLDEVSASYTETNSAERPTWLTPIYEERALAVSPFLVDLAAAYEAGELDQVMGYLNARFPALHVSIIETGLHLEQIAQHLRRFIFIVDPEGRQFTLRYADCAVLAPLSSLLTTAQWASMRGPITRWTIHDRSGALVHLPAFEPAPGSPTPLCLDRDQLAPLDEASEPDHFIAKAKMMRHGATLPGNAAEQYVWARTARQTWRDAENSNTLILMFLTEATLVTEGEILSRPEMRYLLAMDEVGEFRNRLRRQVNEILEKSNHSP